MPERKTTQHGAETRTLPARKAASKAVTVLGAAKVQKGNTTKHTTKKPKKITKKANKVTDPVPPHEDASRSTDETDDQQIDFTESTRSNQNLALFESLRNENEKLKKQNEDLHTRLENEFLRPIRPAQNVESIRPAQKFDDIKSVRNCPKFSGGIGDEYESWASRIKVFLEMYKLTERDKLRVVNSNLNGQARYYIDSLSEGITSVESLLYALKGVFGDNSTRHERLASCVQEQDEPIRQFALRIRRAARSFVNSDSETEQDLLNTLRFQSTPNYQTVLMSCLPSTSFKEAVEHAHRYELFWTSKSSTNKQPKRKFETINQISLDLGQEVDNETEGTAAKRNRSTIDEQVLNQLNSLRTEIKTLNNSQNNNNRFNNRRSSSSYNSKRINACFHCAKAGHRYTECRKASQTDKDTITNNLKQKTFDYEALRKRASEQLTLNSNGGQ
jgi:hypothetical protein